MFDKLHAMCIISFIHSFARDSFAYLFIEYIYLFIYLSDQTFIHLTFEYNIFVLAEVE